VEILLSLGLLIVGGIIGFFAARHWYNKGASQESITQATSELKALLSQQSEHHVFQSKQLIENIEKQCASLREQIRAYENLLTPDSESTKESVHYFGEQADTYLRNQLDKGSRLELSSQSDTQPRDFAQAGSGLFTGKGEVVVEKDQGTKS
jgi:uncharacterized membrane-anchored protein YhcB (DUF1043 family)